MEMRNPFFLKLLTPNLGSWLESQSKQVISFPAEIHFFSVFYLNSQEFTKRKTYTCTHWQLVSVAPSQERLRLVTNWSSRLSCEEVYLYLHIRPLKNRLKREPGTETRMNGTEPETKTSSGTARRVLSVSWDTVRAIDRWKLNHLMCQTRNRICFAPHFLLLQPEYLNFIITLSHSLMLQVTVTLYLINIHNYCMFPGAQKSWGTTLVNPSVQLLHVTNRWKY